MSENPEAQPSTGVLGRIGSWFSPWRGKSSTENAFPTSDQAVKLQQEEESKEPVRAQAKKQQKEEEEEEEGKEQSSIPNPVGLFRNIFLSEEENATQSAHRDGSVVCSTEPTEGGPRREEFAESRKNKIGQGREREESNNATSLSGSPEKSVSHVTDFCSSYEQGVVWDTARTLPQARTQAQAQTGKRLHVYLEETSVIQCGEDPFAGQEVVHTRVSKSLPIICRAKSLPSLDPPKSPSSTSAEKKSTNVRSTDGTECHYSALVGVSLKPQQASQFVPEPDKKQTEADSMGRKNTARRKFKKHSQGEEGSSSHEKKPPIAETVAEGSPTSDNSVPMPQGKSPRTYMEESAVNSTSKDSPTSQGSPELGESKTSCPDKVKPLDDFQDSVPAATVVRVVDRTMDMEDEDDLYKVERKTETSESKRRSIKVSRSEIKLFTKNVPFNPKQRPEEDNEEFKSLLKNTKDESKDKPETEISARLRGLKKLDEEPKPVVGRIADKISLFERPAGGVNALTFQTPRSANVSPARKAADKLKANVMLSNQRSRSADTTRSSSASPAREGPKTIKERVKNFTEASEKPDTEPCPFKSVMTGMSQKSTSSVADPAPESGGLDHQGKLDTKEQIQSNTMPVLALKPNGLDTTALGANVSIPKEQLTNPMRKDTVTLKTADQGKTLNSVEANVSAEGTSDSIELSDSPQSKGASRTGSRSKRRKSREPTSPLKPNSKNRADCSAENPVVPAVDQKQVDDAETASASKQLTEEVSVPGKGQGNAPDDTKQKTSTKEPDVLDKQEELLHSSFIKDNIDKLDSRQEMEPSVNKDEPDTAACSSGTKICIDKDTVILSQKEEMTGGQNLLFMHERDKASKDNREAPVSSPSPVDKKQIEKQDPLAKHSRLDEELLVQSKQKSKVKIGEPNKNKTVQTQETQDKVTELPNLTESTDMEKFEKSNITSEIEKTEKETPPQLQHSNKNINVSDTRQNILDRQGSVVLDDGRNNAKMTQAVRDKRKPETRQPEPASAPSEKTPSILPDQTQHVKQMTTHPPKAVAICAITQTNEKAVTGTKSDKQPLKDEKNVSSELPCKSPESPGTATEPVTVTVEPQSESVLVEQMDNAPDDSCTHGANDAELSAAKSFTKATAAVEEVASKATCDTPALITARADSMSEKDSSVEEPTLISVSKSVSSEGEGQDNRKNPSTVKSVPSEVKLPGEIMNLTTEHPQCDASENRESTLKGLEKMEKRTTDGTSSVAIVHVAEKTAFHLPVSELVGRADVLPQPQISTVKKETVDEKLSQTPKVPTSQEANKLILDSIQHSSMKKLHFPRGLSKDDSATQQDAPSSWLDVDLPKRKLKVPVPKLSSSGSESNLLDTSGELDDEDFVEKIKKLCAPFSLPPRKHNPLGPHQPPFALPSIREDHFEKTFDPEEFTFGLRAKNKYTIDNIPSTLAKLQNLETKSSMKPARASLADRSILLNSLDIHSRLKTGVKEDENVSEEKDDQIKVKSRLEGSCVFSRLTSSILREKGNGVETQAEGANSGKVSPSEAPQLSPPPLSQPPPPSPTDIAPLKDTLAKQNPALSNGEKSQTVEVVVSDSGPPLPSFNDIKLPDYLEKYLPREPENPVANKQGQEQGKTQVFGKMPTQPRRVEAELALKPGLVLPDAMPPPFPVNSPNIQPPLTEQPPAQPQGLRSKSKRTAKGFHKRPGKMVLFENAQFSGQVYEIYRDVADATSLQLSPLISVKVVRGCWLLYEKPDFQGRSIALEEGGIELTNVWAELGPETEAHPPMLIGSIRLVVWDYSIPHIDLFTEPEGLGRVTPYHDDTVETGSFGIPLSTASIQVHSGVWLVFSDPGFQGMLAVLQTGVYPFPETWGFPSPFVGSLRPLKMGGFKVENASEVKAVVYEKPGFEGSFLEIDSDVFSFCESEGGISADGAISDSKKPKSVGSFKIIGGLWVGYSEPGFEGQQHILEEGEYFDSSDWGGSELISLRPVLSDFFSPHLKMFSDTDFSERGVSIDLTVPVINMEDTGYGMRTQSIDVVGGIWVVFEEPGFCGEPYVLERGLYGCPEDWGALRPRVASAMPVVLDDFENTAKFKVQLFSEPGFQGSVLALEDSAPSLQEGFSLASCKVLAGSWLAFEGQGFAGKMYVLEEGSYSDLRAMGCVPPSSSILSLQTVGFEFSLPSITLFERCGLRGKRVILTDGTVNLQLAGGCSRVQSVLVEGGMWVLYEGINYRGAQILLKPGEVSDWHELSSWPRIGSLRPLTMKQVHFRLRNRQTGLMMSVTGDLDDIQLMRVQEAEETDGFEQIWFYQNGHLHCKLLEECCLSPSGSMMMAGSRVGLTPEPGNHLWSITPAGFIRYTPTSNLVLEVKGGLHFDKNQVILNTLDPNKLQQQWNVEII